MCLHFDSSPLANFKTMKKIFLTFLLISTTALFSFSQKANLQKADNYRKYEQYDKAKEAIDAATLDEQTKGMEKTWYYRGLIYPAGWVGVGADESTGIFSAPTRVTLVALGRRAQRKPQAPAKQPEIIT